MDKIFRWINQHKVMTIVLLVIIVFFPLVVIHVIFKIRVNCYWIKSEWSAGEVLSYFGEVLSFIGTMVLGYVAIKQTEKSNSLSDKLVQIEEERRMPILDIVQYQKCKIFFKKKYILRCIERYNHLKDMKVELHLKKTDGVAKPTTTIASMVVKVKNIGNSDIKGIIVKDNSCSLWSLMLAEHYECGFPIWEGNTYIRKGHTKKLFIEIKMDIDKKEKKGMRKNIKNPEFDFDLWIGTPDDSIYYEHFVFYVVSAKRHKNEKKMICSLCSQQITVKNK